MLNLDFVVISPLIAGLLYALAAVYSKNSWKHSPDSPVGPVAIYLLLSMILSFGLALERGLELASLKADPLAVITQMGIAVLAGGFLLVLRTVLGMREKQSGWKIFALVWLACAIFSLPIGWLIRYVFSPGDHWEALLALIQRGLILVGWTTFTAASARLILKNALRDSLHPKRTVSWLAPLILIAVGDGLLLIEADLAGDLLRVAGGWAAAMILCPPALSVESAMDESRRTRGNSIGLAVFSGIIYFGLTFAALSVARRWLDVDPIWISLLLAAILVLGANPWLERIRTGYQPKPDDPSDAISELLRQYSLSITNTLDLNLLATVAVGTASEYLEIRRGYLFLVETEPDPTGNDFKVLRGAKGMGDKVPSVGRFDAQCPMVQYFRSNSEPITHRELSEFSGVRESSQGGFEWLSELDADVYVPIHSKDEWIGLLVLGPKDTGQPFTAKDRVFLSAMASQTAVALENARLFERSVRLNEETRRAYQALEQANLHLERLDKSKSDFLTIVTHELRTPMTLISGAGQLLLDEADLRENPYVEKLLQNLKVGIQRMDKILESMLEMARIDTRAIQLDLQPVAIHRVIQMVFTELSADAEKRSQRLEVFDLEPLPEVLADLPGLKQVFYNLVINAIKYTPDGGKITICGREIPPGHQDLPNGGVEVIVQDTGIGIDPEFRDLVFIKFYQAGDASQHSSGRTKFKGGGPGLGLSIARGIVEAHHGKIWVESPGYDEQNFPGCHFHVLLPLRPYEKPDLFEKPG